MRCRLKMFTPASTEAPVEPVADAGLPLPKRYCAIAVVALGVTLSVLDSAIANVALPTIARHLQISATDSIWIINAYQMTVTIALLPLSSPMRHHRHRHRPSIAVVIVIAHMSLSPSSSPLRHRHPRVTVAVIAVTVMKIAARE